MQNGGFLCHSSGKHIFWDFLVRTVRSGLGFKSDVGLNAYNLDWNRRFLDLAVPCPRHLGPPKGTLCSRGMPRLPTWRVELPFSLCVLFFITWGSRWSRILVKPIMRFPPAAGWSPGLPEHRRPAPPGPGPAAPGTFCTARARSRRPRQVLHRPGPALPRTGAAAGRADEPGPQRLLLLPLPGTALQRQRAPGTRAAVSAAPQDSR